MANNIKFSKKIIGTVSLVGAGPGDPGLLTLKAQDRLKRAQIVFYDHLVNPEILQHCPQAILRHVGKQGYGPHASQRKIELQLIRSAKKYFRIVRLKGGDPFIFGRGGEEAEALQAAGIPFEVVPGVTSAVAVPAYAGIPLTHRSFGSSVCFVTGHEAAGGPSLGKSDWRRLAKERTLVFLMGVKSLRKNFLQLQKYGKNPKTPAAIVQWGTYPRQRTLQGTLANLPDLAQAAGIASPAVTIVGPVVSLRNSLRWYDRPPLLGKTIVLTRPQGAADSLEKSLLEQGAKVIHIPALKIVPPSSWVKVDAAIRRIQDYDWLIFTSVHGVEKFFSRVPRGEKCRRFLKKVRFAVVGPATGQALEKLGWKAHLMPPKLTSRDLGRALKKMGIRGKKILFLRAAHGRDDMIDELRNSGAQLDLLPVYRTIAPRISPRRWRHILRQGRPDLLVFTSGAAARNFKDMLLASPLVKPWLRIPVAAIGTVTRDEAEQLGFKIAVLPERYTIEDLQTEILEFFKK